MNKTSPKTTEPESNEQVSPAIKVAPSPVIFPAVGRQRVGKTTLLNALAQVAQARGGRPEIWNTDLLNRSHSIGSFHVDALTPEHGQTTEQRFWIEARIMEQLERRQDVILDVGGGWTALHELIDETPLAEIMKAADVALVVAYVIGTEAGDVDYLDALANEKLFVPEKTLIVLNEGLVAHGRTPSKAFEQILRHRVIANARNAGARVVFMPSLTCMAEVTDRGLTFADFANGVQADGHPPTSVFDRARVRRWFEQDFPSFLRKIPTDWLPRLPAGQSY